MGEIRNISDEELEAINQAVYKRYGIDFRHYEYTSMKRRVARVLHRFDVDTIYRLWSLMLKDNNLIYRYIDEITVGLTEMFRNPELWIQLRDHILPKYTSGNTPDIWHAGCSTGEEVYSMALVLYEAGLLDKTKVLATDLNGTSVEKAKAGRFDTELIRGAYTRNYSVYNPRRRLTSYCSCDEVSCEFNPKFKENIKFKTHDLARQPIYQKFDIIFCRNVMIYFDDVLKAKVQELLFNALKDDGYLIIGYYDSLTIDNASFFKPLSAKHKIYVKNENQRG